MKNKSIKAQILIPVLTMLVIGIVLQIVIVSTQSTATANELSTSLIEETVDSYANEFDAISTGAYGSVSALAPIAFTTSGMENGREVYVEMLKSYLLQSPDLISIWTAWEPNAYDGNDAEYVNAPYHDETGRFVAIISKTGSGASIDALVDYDNPVEGDYYQGAKSSGMPHITDPYYYNLNGQTVLLYTISIPILKDGNVVGAVGADINVADVADIMNAGRVFGDGYFFTLSPSGLISTHPDSDFILTNYAETWLNELDSEFQTLYKNGGTHTASSYSATLKKNIIFSAAAVTIGTSDDHWLVCSVVPAKSVTASADSMRNIIIIAGAALIAAIGAMIFISLRRALKQMPMLTGVAHSIADGDVMSIALIENDGTPTRNEVELLIRAFTAMITNIQGQVTAVQSIAKGDLTVEIQPQSEKDALNIALRDLVQSNNRVFSEILSASNAVSDVAGALSESSQHLAQASVEQSASVEELSASIENVAKQTGSNEQTAIQAAEMAANIKLSAEKGNEKMDDMVQAVHEISEASKNIGNVISVIEDIAFQTNILALNASVEAARAGQHGKGFAVVAEEVRTLANKSAEAAQNTAELITESLKKSELGTSLATETSGILGEIVAGIGTTSDMVAKIPVATREQSVAIDQINTGISQITEAVHQSSATSEESAATSQEMSSQAVMLKQLVERFKLK